MYEKIIARMIADKADVTLVLLNYHFGSKENLITIYMRRVIGKVVIGTQYSLLRSIDAVAEDIDVEL